MSVNGLHAQTNAFDQFGKQVVNIGSAPFTFAHEVKEFVKSAVSERTVHHEYSNDSLSIPQLAKRVLEFYVNWHFNVVINSIGYAHNVEKLVERVVKWPLAPLSITETTKAIQILIAEKIIGTLVFAVTFVVLQFFHIIPYIASIVVLTGTFFFYQTSPVALITLLAASILLLNVYFLYYLSGEVRAGNNTLKEGFKDAQATLEQGKKTLTDGIDVIKRGVDSIEGDVKNLVIPTILWAGAVVIVSHYSPAQFSPYLHGAAATAIGLNYVIPAVRNIWRSRFAVRQ